MTYITKQKSDCYKVNGKAVCIDDFDADNFYKKVLKCKELQDFEKYIKALGKNTM
jgi:hypothetical protein